MRSRRCIGASLAAAALLCGARGAAGARDDASAAQQAFAAGRRLFLAGSPRLAIEAFERAYRLKPLYLVQCSIARCHETLGELRAAAARYERCLNEGAAGTAIAARVRATLAEVRAKTLPDLSRLAPAPAPPRPAARTLLPQPSRDLAARRPSAAAPRARGLAQHWFWIAAGAAVGLGATTAVLGAKTLSCKQDYVQDPTAGRYDECWRYRLLTNLFAGGTAVAGGSGVALFFLTDFGGAREQRQAVGGVTVNLRGAF